jgi:hypothetical protein
MKQHKVGFLHNNLVSDDLSLEKGVKVKTWRKMFTSVEQFIQQYHYLAPGVTNVCISPKWGG